MVAENTYELVPTKKTVFAVSKKKNNAWMRVKIGSGSGKATRASK